MSNIFRGTLRDMFATTYASVEQTAHPEFWHKGQVYSYWLHYYGPDCEPFDVYARFSFIGITLANLSAKSTRKRSNIDSVTKKGRMPLIVEAAATVKANVFLEQVHNPHLYAWALRYGFQPKAGYNGILWYVKH